MEQIVNAYLPVEKETLEAYGVRTWTELFPQGEELYRPIHGQMWQYHLPKDVSDTIDAADRYVLNSLISCIVNPPEEFDSRWQTMVETLKEMGVEEAGQKMTEIVNKKLKLWYGD